MSLKIFTPVTGAYLRKILLGLERLLMDDGVLRSEWMLVDDLKLSIDIDCRYISKKLFWHHYSQPKDGD